MTSTNANFMDIMQRDQNKWKTEGEITSDELSNIDRDKFNGMVEIEEWSKSDPKDYAIASLTTRMNNLEGEKYRGSGGNKTKAATTKSFGKWNSGDASG